jgi:hypothetical protein
MIMSIASTTDSGLSIRPMELGRCGREYDTQPREQQHGQWQADDLPDDL